MKSIKVNSKKVQTLVGLTAGFSLGMGLIIPSSLADNNSLGSDSFGSLNSENSQQSAGSNQSNNSWNSLNKNIPMALQNRNVSAQISTITDGLGTTSGVTISSDGNAYVTDSGPIGVGTPSKLYKVNLSSGAKTLVTDNLPKYSGIPRFDKEGKNMYLTSDYGVKQLDLETKKSQIIAAAQGDPNFVGTAPKLVVNPVDGKLYISQYSGFNAGNIEAYNGTPMDTTLIKSLGFDPSGVLGIYNNSILVNDGGVDAQGSGKIESIDLTSGSIKTIVTEKKYAAAFASVIDKTGNLYVAYIDGLTKSTLEKLKKGMRISDGYTTIIDKINLNTGEIQSNIAKYSGLLDDLAYVNGSLIATSMMDGKLLRITP